MATYQPPAQRYREIAIKTANPLQLVVILYDGAIQALQEAQGHLQQKNIPQRARCLNRAIAIISELQACLNFKEGHEIAGSLDRLYNYMKNRVFQANVQQDPEMMTEVILLLENLRTAWRELARQGQAPGASPAALTNADSGVLNSSVAEPNQPTGVNICG